MTKIVTRDNIEWTLDDLEREGIEWYPDVDLFLLNDEFYSRAMMEKELSENKGVRYKDYGEGI